MGGGDNRLVSDCCSPKGYRWVFSERAALSEAKGYRRKGLDSTSRRIVEFVKREGVENRTVLGVGGGIGAIQIELLKAGASRATSVELTPTYEQVAGELLKEAGLQDRVDRKVMDFVDASAELEPADVVIMNRVICCYHDMPRLAGAAADPTREPLGMTYPKRALWATVGLGLANSVLRATRREVHNLLHAPGD